MHFVANFKMYILLNLTIFFLGIYFEKLYLKTQKYRPMMFFAALLVKATKKERNVSKEE